MASRSVAVTWLLESSLESAAKAGVQEERVTRCPVFAFSWHLKDLWRWAAAVRGGAWTGQWLDMLPCGKTEPKGAVQLATLCTLCCFMSRSRCS